MAFGWFGKKAGGDKGLEKARKLADQGRWAEALTYYEEGSGDDARRGARSCRERLVACNLEEARTYAAAGDAGKAREHARLAADLAVDEADLLAEARGVLDSLGGPERPAAAAPRRERLFAPSCACPSSCAAGCEPEEAGEAVADEELFEFYLEGLSQAEREVLEPLGPGFREGFVLLQQGDAEAARPLLAAAEAATPGAVGPRYALGLLAAVEHDVEGALAQFARALEAEPGFAAAALHRAGLLREAGRPGEAVEFLSGWVAGHPDGADEAEARVLLAACRLEAGDPSGALSEAQEAGRRSPAEDPRPKLLQAQALRRLGQADQALGALQAVAARRPDLLEALVPLGQLLLEKGGPSAERAVEVFKRCYRLDPERGWWHLLRVAEAYAARGWKAEARSVLDSARQELPDAPEPRAEWDAVSRLAG